jgi:DNA-binding LacI/PurR family transcriptional regulator
MTRTTLKDVAAKVGVSYQTVSKVLNGQAQVAPDTEERIWQVVQEMDYRPNVSARNLRTQAINLLGCAWAQTLQGAWRPVLNRFLHSVIDAAEREGYLTAFFAGPGGQVGTQSYADLYLQRQVAGFILADTLPDDPRISFLIDNQIPFAAFGQANSDWDFCWVDVDGYDGIRQIMHHVHERGHCKVGFITWDDYSKTGMFREKGYCDGLEAIGQGFDPNWIFRGNDSALTGQKGLTALMSLPPARRPTAIVCVSDHIAIGAVNAALAHGLQVGKDIAITGYDDVSISRYLYPPLTTVSQPIGEVGGLVIDLLLRQIHDKPLTQKTYLLKPELVVRESS